RRASQTNARVASGGRGVTSDKPGVLRHQERPPHLLDDRLRRHSRVEDAVERILSWDRDGHLTKSLLKLVNPFGCHHEVKFPDVTCLVRACSKEHGREFRYGVLDV